MQIHADKRAAILKFDIGKTADRKRAIFRRIPARRENLNQTSFMNIICFNFKDVDECVEGSHDCFPNFATCVNIPGSYNCVCSHSYTEDNTCLPEGTEY